MKNLIYIISAMCCVVLLSCCSDTTAPDPCSGSEPVTAHFTMYEGLYNKKAPADTVLAWNTVVFAADKKYDSYQWRIGTDARVWSDSLVSLRFEEAIGDVPIRLIVHGKPNTTCFANDDGIDTLTKILHVINRATPRVTGFYHGYNTDAPRDTFTFSLQYLDLGAFGMRYVLNNLNKGCMEPVPDGPNRVLLDVGYRAFQFHSSGWTGRGCDDPEGIAILQGDGDSIVVQYSLVDRSDVFKRIPKTFVGKRVY